nr:9431_t:CDS:2 [Entrophospora candida]
MSTNLSEFEENFSELENFLSEVETFEGFQDSNIFQSFVEEDEGLDEEFENDYEDNEVTISSDDDSDYFEKCSLMVFDLEKGCSMPCTRYSYRKLQQCIGVWEINTVSVKDADKELGKLGVCKYHFNLDQTPSYHPSGLKQKKSVDHAKMLSKRCLFCHKIFNIYSRDNYCDLHSWQISDKKFLTSCICQFTCPSRINEFLNKKSHNIANASPRYICQDCCHKNECHIYNPPGRGRTLKECSHKNDLEQVLRKIGSWITDVANSNNFEEKQKLLSNILPSLVAHWNNNETPQKPYQETPPSHFPSPFLINTILKLKGADKLYEKQKGDLNPNQSFNYGESLGKFILKSRKHINEHQQQLAKPNSLIEYYQAFPKVITKFFDGLIGVILNHHHRLKQYKRKYYNLKTKIDDTEQDPMQLIKITTFLSSVIIKMAFRRSKIWFTNLFASLCRRPQFLGSLQSILRSLHVISHTEDHERRLEVKRMEKVDPKSRIITGPNVWPLAVIDNLDTKQKTFKYNNYYNEGRLSLHVVLRMLFFFTLPSPIQNIVDEQSMIYQKNNIFEFNSFSSKNIELFENIFKKLLNYQIDGNFDQVDEEEIHQEIIKHIPKGTSIFLKILKPNTTHHLIEMAPELTTDGFNSLFKCYDVGKERMETLLNQEVYGTEKINTTGRRATNVKTYKYEKLVENYKKKGKEKVTNLEEMEVIEDPKSDDDTINLSTTIEEGESTNRRQYRRITVEEHAILDPLVEMDDKPTKEQISDACEKTGLGRKKILDYVGKGFGEPM